ncbi:Pentatricopeptide repeat-containing protein [Musa troglodytarum]|uniref:Pentatricopeptide repeat-containing protein n=1 Tax=Musa troglodytarum TaxID=320322 RepID=A0A9E7JMS0_9LILI|nr:Pentatricopeptide repeat-containing protein [Musa troglodytarum]
MVVQELSAVLKALCRSNIAAATATTNAQSLALGKLVHAKSVSLGLQSNSLLCRALVGFYLSFHLLDPALKVLESNTSDDVSPWNALLSACSKRQLHAQALCLFQKLLLLSPRLKPDAFTYPSAIKACAGLGAARNGEVFHAGLMKSGFAADVVISSSLVYMYAKCDRFSSAIQLFDEMTHKDAACWNTVMSCYYQSGQASKALELFEEMKRCGFEPDCVTYTTAFSACARLEDLERGRRMHEELNQSGFELDAFISSAIVDMYAKCGCLESARDVFEQIPSKSVVSWNSIIGGYSSAGDSHSSLILFRRMAKEGVKPTSTTISCLLMACSRSSNSQHGKFIHGYIVRNCIEVDIFVASSLVDFYFKCRIARHAESVFEKMPKSNVVSWNVMISGYVMVGCYFKALELFHGMRVYGVGPDAITFTCVLSACAQLAALEQGREIHKQISNHGLECNEIVMCTLVDMYAKCGAISEAREVFDRLATKDILSWTSMIMAYGSHGQASEALKLFHEMQKVKTKLDHVTFLAVLTACSHGGLVDEGRHYFDQMTNRYGIKPHIEHYSCLIDLLGRSGRLNEAYSVLKKSTPEIRADAGLLGSLFSACSLHRNLELGEEVAKLLVEVDPDDHSTYVTLANMYASVGRWDDVRKVRATVKERGLKKNPGCSWIEIEKRIHQFFVKDDSHPQAELIHEWLGYLSLHMKQEKSDGLMSMIATVD